MEKLGFQQRNPQEHEDKAGHDELYSKKDKRSIKLG
jgi:hypothetical protein